MIASVPVFTYTVHDLLHYNVMLSLHACLYVLYIGAKDSHFILFDCSLSLSTAGEITSAVSHIMVPNPTKAIIADTQHRLTSIINELQKSLSKLLITSGGQSFSESVARSVYL